MRTALCAVLAPYAPMVVTAGSIRPERSIILIQHVERGGTLQTHHDVPLAIREQLYAEEQQRQDRKSGKLVRSPGNPSSVTINILPVQPHQKSLPDAQTHSIASVQIWDTTPAQDLEIEGPRDVAVQEYTDWQQEQVRDPTLKEEVRKARDAMLEEGYDLEQIYKDRNSGFFIEKGVRPGIAKRFRRRYCKLEQASQNKWR